MIEIKSVSELIDAMRVYVREMEKDPADRDPAFIQSDYEEGIRDYYSKILDSVTIVSIHYHKENKLHVVEYDRVVSGYSGPLMSYGKPPIERGTIKYPIAEKFMSIVRGNMLVFCKSMLSAQDAMDVAKSNIRLKMNIMTDGTILPELMNVRVTDKNIEDLKGCQNDFFTALEDWRGLPVLMFKMV